MWRTNLSDSIPEIKITQFAEKILPKTYYISTSCMNTTLINESFKFNYWLTSIRRLVNHLAADNPSIGPVGFLPQVWQIVLYDLRLTPEGQHAITCMSFRTLPRGICKCQEVNFPKGISSHGGIEDKSW